MNFKFAGSISATKLPAAQLAIEAVRYLYTCSKNDVFRQSENNIVL